MIKRNNSFETSAAERQFSRRRKTASMALVAMTLTGCTQEAPTPRFTIVPAPTDAPDIVVELPEQKCEDPTPESIASVEQTFTAPENPEVTSLTDTYGFENIDQGLYDIRRGTAERNGLTIYDYRQEFKGLSDELYIEGTPQQSFETYFKQAQEFVGRYGVTLSVAETEEQLGLSTDQTLTMSALENREAKLSLSILIRNIGELPVELVEYMGLKKIVFVKTQANEDGKEAAGWADTLDGETFYMDPLDYAGNVFNHEIFHLWDSMICGEMGMHGDETYNTFNPEPMYDQSYDPDILIATGERQYKGDDEIATQSLLLYNQLSTPEVINDPAAKESIQSEINELKARVAVNRAYGFKNIAEDKATLGESILNPFTYSDHLDHDSPILRAKFVFLLSRIYEDKPEIIQYLADVSRRPINN